MIRAGEALAEFVDWTPDTGNDIETRFVVVSMLGHHHYVRLIPVSVNTGRREKVCDIKLGGEEHAQALKGHLLKMGFTAVVPPERSVIASRPLVPFADPGVSITQ